MQADNTDTYTPMSWYRRLTRPGKILFLVSVIFCLFVTGKYTSHKTVFYGDAAGYYMYLPSVFIYHNLTTFEPLPEDRGLSELVRSYSMPRIDPQDSSRFIINQYTYGVALTELPFFAAAHAYSLLTGGQANGYSAAYEWAIRLGNILYSLLGLILVYRILRRYHSSTTAMTVSVLLLTGTNLFWFTFLQAGMAHVPLFFLYALLMHLTMITTERPSVVRLMAIGLVCGFITIMRPTDILCMAIPVFYGLHSRQSIIARMHLLRDNLKGIILAAICFAIPMLPQMMYWKATTGHWLYYSYREQSFFWKHPWIVDGLFYCSNGWLAYTPLMLLALAGMLLLRSIKQWAATLWLLLPTYIYVVYSWYCYNYINGFGSRPMLHVYPLLAIPLAAFIIWVWRRGIVLRVLCSAVILFCIAMNLSQSYQQMRGMLWSEESNLQYNAQMLFRTRLRYEDLVVRDIGEFQPDTASLTLVGTVAELHYNDSTSPGTVPDPATGEKYVYYMHDEEYPQQSILATYSKATFKDARWMKCSGRFLCTAEPNYFRHMLVTSIGDKLWRGMTIENKCINWPTEADSSYVSIFYTGINRWTQLYYFTRIPEGLNETDYIKLFVWSKDLKPIYLDDLKVELYK